MSQKKERKGGREEGRKGARKGGKKEGGKKSLSDTALCIKPSDSFSF
jgi:hypothetical protein